MDILTKQKKEIDKNLIEKDISKVAFLATSNIDVVSGGKKLILEKGKKYTIIEQEADDKEKDDKEKEDEDEKDVEKKDKEDDKDSETKESKKRKAEKKCKEEEDDKEDDEKEDETDVDDKEDNEEDEDKKVEKKVKKVKESVITSIDKVSGYLVGDANFIIRKEDGSEMEVIGEDGEYIELYPNAVDSDEDIMSDMQDMNSDMSSFDNSFETEIEDETINF
jgi:hypothetical protein